MTWLIEQGKSQTELARLFKERMGASEILQMAGAYDGMSALMAKNAEFKALYLSGAAYTASRGLPDLGLIHSQEMAERARDIIRASNLPLLVDIDTGYGSTLNVARAAREMVEARVAAIQIEDQDLPKKCGHLNGKRLVPDEEMMQKISMIKAAAPSLIVVARTDARAVEGMEQAILRARSYIAAGADAIFPEALTEEAEFRRFRSEVDAPLLANMTEFGQTPYFTAEQFKQMGCDMVIYPVTALRAAAKAYERVFAEILQKGSQKDCLDQMQTRKQLYETIRYFEYEEMDNNIARTILPEEEK